MANSEKQTAEGKLSTGSVQVNFLDKKKFDFSTWNAAHCRWAVDTHHDVDVGSKRLWKDRGHELAPLKKCEKSREKSTDKELLAVVDCPRLQVNIIGNWRKLFFISAEKSGTKVRHLLRLKPRLAVQTASRQFTLSADP
jgi:hypothetical protein